MRFMIVFIILSIILTPIYSITLNNRADISISPDDLFSMAEIVSETYGVEVTQLSVYYEKNVLVYEFEGYKTIQEGYATMEIPKTLKLNENLDPLITTIREDKIGFSAIILGIPGVISYLTYKVIGLL